MGTREWGLENGDWVEVKLKCQKSGFSGKG